MREHAGDKPFAKEGYELMAAAFEVHNVQGGGLLEENLTTQTGSHNEHVPASIAHSFSVLSISVH